MTGSILALAVLFKGWNWAALGFSIAEFFVLLWATMRLFYVTEPAGDPNMESTFRTWRVNVIHILFALVSGIASLVCGIVNMVNIPIIGNLPGGLQIASFVIELVASWLAFYFREYWLDYDPDMRMADYAAFDIFGSDTTGYESGDERETVFD